MKNTIIVGVVVVVLVGASSFFAGMQLQKRQQPQFGTGQLRGQLKGGQGFGTQNGQGMQPVSGEVISKDDTGITIKLEDGSTKIVILADTTSINKTETGSISDLKEGDKVTAFGTTNTDGTITAQNVSIGGMFRVGKVPNQNEQN